MSTRNRGRRRPAPMAGEQTIAAFDSASAMHASLANALRGKPFWHVGQGRAAAFATRVGGRTPWPILRSIYAQIGANEGLPPDQLDRVDLDAVAAYLTGRYPVRRFPAVMVGSSNGALTHLAAAAQIPWLPGTTLIPVSRWHDPHDLDAALDFSRRVAPPLLDRNPDIVLHHMHDQIQDELMVAKMAYFRMKWRRLPPAYETFLRDRLLPEAPVILVEDTSTWTVVRVGRRHVFQPGAQGGVPAETYLARAKTPTPDDTAAEAEWGAEPDLTAALEQWCQSHGHPLVRISYHGPQAPAHAVAETFRSWYRRRGEDDTRLLVPCFILLDPWTTIDVAAVPYWTFFAVQPALAALRDHLDRTAPYHRAHVLLFEHGADSLGIAPPAAWEAALTDHGCPTDFLGLDRRRFPHDISFMARYGPNLSKLSRARSPWSPMGVEEMLNGLSRHGVRVIGR